MKSTSLRRAAAASLVLVPVLAACGFNEPTDQIYQPATGVNNRDGQVDILNALIVSGADGSGTFVADLVNENQTQTDELESMTGPSITVSSARTTIPAGGSVNLATDGKLAVRGSAVAAGNFVALTLVFANGQSTTVKVPVVRNDGDYASVPVPAPTN